MNSPTTPNFPQYPQTPYPDPTAFPPQQQIDPDVAEQMRQQVEWMRLQMQQMQMAQAQMAYEQAQAAAQAQYFAQQQGYAPTTPYPNQPAYGAAPYPSQYYGTPGNVFAEVAAEATPATENVPVEEVSAEKSAAPAAEEIVPAPAPESAPESVPAEHPEETPESVPAEVAAEEAPATENVPVEEVSSEKSAALAAEETVPAPAPESAPESVPESVSASEIVPVSVAEISVSAPVAAATVGISPSVHCAYGKMWRGFFRFGGRTSREEFRRAFFANALIVLALWAVGSLLACISYAALKGSSISASWASYAFIDACEKISDVTLRASLIAGAAVVFFCIVSFIPMFAMILRRLRDAGKSPMCLLLMLIPFVGPIFLPIWLCFAAQKKESVPANQTAA